MIPVKLALCNFMCYRDNIPPISFEGIHTACISGNNGNGKSALIDAITWALWGQTRATSDDDLVHSGQTEAQVEFEFTVGTQNYRIIRKHSKPKNQKSSGQTILEFQMATPEGYKILTGDSTTKTQQKIIQVLHMDYETFINSAFLKQGRADEFTKKRPGDRKQVLGNILQLSVYDELEERAKDVYKKQELAIAQLETSLKTLQEELSLKPAFQSELEKSLIDLSEIDALVKERDMNLTASRKEKDALENKKLQLADFIVHIQETEHNFNLWNHQAQQCRLRIQEYEELIIKRTEIETHYNQYLETQKLFQEAEQKFKQINALTQSRHRLELSVIKAMEELNRNHAVEESRLRDLEITAGKLPKLQDEIEQITGLQKLLDKEEARLQEKRENSKLQRAQVHLLQAEQVRMVQEIAQIEEKIKMLSHDDSVTCPLCETELGIEGQKRIEVKYKVEKLAKSEALKGILAELNRKEGEVNAAENDVTQLEVSLKRSREASQSKAGNLYKSLSDSREAAEKVAVVRKTLGEYEEKLVSRNFAINEQNALSQIEREITSIEYDPLTHDSLKEKLNELATSEMLKRKLEDADRQIVQEKEAEDKACKTAAGLRFKIENDIQKKQSLIADLDAFATVAERLAVFEKEYQESLLRQKQVQESLGGIKARLERLNELEVKLKEKENQLNQSTKQEKIYRDLAQAFGKKGIQAMLIELAIPEIEIEANKLLARMTDNRMHIKMETQRETKKGDVMETLDINISDELGTRNYEMFSGGESFRIDFAIRIALSKLLARRAGAPLPTLIIDEGFGTQDSTGIEKIKEAITSIQDDFEKILVITHIADFKDSFPLRIEVVKTTEGSTVYLN